MERDELIKRVRNIRIWKQRDVHAPHKPLLLLYGLANLQRGSTRFVKFSEAEEPLKKLLGLFGPARDQQSPEYPFWRLVGDGLWEIPEIGGNHKPGHQPGIKENEVHGGKPSAGALTGPRESSILVST